MTIPAGARCNWCPSCEEECNDHPRMCTVCGTDLQYRETSERTRQPTTGRESTGHALLASMEALQQLPRGAVGGLDGANELGQLIAQLESMRERIAEAREILRHGQGAAGGGGDDWEAIPAALLDPHAGASSQFNSRGTSKEFLKNMTKITLGKNSSLFYRATLSVPKNNDDSGAPVHFDAIPADFGGLSGSKLDSSQIGTTATTAGQRIQHDASTTCLIVADPKTGKGGRLSDATLRSIQTASERNKTVVLYMERGDNVSFIDKARLAQASGAKVLVVGNHQAEPWPYIMKDSSNDSKDDGGTKDRVDIPVVMVKQADGKAIVRACTDQPHDASMLDGVSFAMERIDNHECIICQEAYQEGGRAIRIPVCGHVYHEDCGMMWLTQHNTCPFCRRELPTDDADYEAERRRQQRTHAGSQGQTNTQYEEFYG